MLITIILNLLMTEIIYSYTLCDYEENLYCNKPQSNASSYCSIKSATTIRSRDCSQVGFASNENLKYNFGEISLHLKSDNRTSKLVMNLTLPDVKWKRAYLRLSEYVDPSICKLFTVGKSEKLSINELFYSCSWRTIQVKDPRSYVMELKAESSLYYAHRKILFDIPDPEYFADTTPLAKRHIFSYIDFTNFHKIVLKIQPLPESYNVQHYKVEVIRERAGGSGQILDVRLLPANGQHVLDFEHMTYNEEGYHYFAISVIGDGCEEDKCAKTITTKLFIGRKGTPLVIGIVGASFLIPFVLFSFYMWNCRHKAETSIPETVDKALVLFKPSFEKHNEVVSILAKAVKYITGVEVMLDPLSTTVTKQDNSEKWCSDNLIRATHIIYVIPPQNEGTSEYEFDYMTYSFLKEEMRKNNSSKKIVVVSFPYCNKHVPQVLSGCPKFEFMDDFAAFLGIFKFVLSSFDYQNNINYIELSGKVKQVVNEMGVCNKAPKILVTGEEETEIDVLL
nr:unnamed protein product [Callosobruchus chinensis]